VIIGFTISCELVLNAIQLSIRWLLSLCDYDPASNLIYRVENEQLNLGRLLEDSEFWFDEEVTYAVDDQENIIAPHQWDPTNPTLAENVKTRKVRKRRYANITMELYLMLFSRSDNGVIQYLTAQSMARAWFEIFSPRTRPVHRVQMLAVAMDMLSHPTTFKEKIHQYKQGGIRPQF